jgi:hypothetical protein
MHTPQWRTLVAGLTGSLLTGFFPPWICPGGQAGRNLLFRPLPVLAPADLFGYERSRHLSCAVNGPRLLGEWTLIGLLTTGVLVFLPRRKASAKAHHETAPPLMS